MLDLVQLYLVDLVQQLWPAGLSGAEAVDLVQHMEVDLVQRKGGSGKERQGATGSGRERQGAAREG